MKIGEFTDAFERMALNESLKESFKILKGEEEYAYEDLGNAGINPKDVEAYAGGDDGDVFYIIFKDGSKKVFFNHAGMTQSAAECGLDNDEEVENFESFELYESFKDPIRKRSRRVNEAFDYDQAVAYIESKGIGCDPCQDIEGEHVCDLLDELGGGLGSEDYSKEELDRIVSSALEFKKDAETWDDDFEESLEEDMGDKYKIVYEPYERYTSSGVNEATFTAPTLYDALCKLCDNMHLYLDREQIEEEQMTAEDIVNYITSINGDGCDYIFKFENLSSGEVIIDGGDPEDFMDDWDYEEDDDLYECFDMQSMLKEAFRLQEALINAKNVEPFKEDYTVWFETPGGDADIAGTYKDRETAELVASDLDDSWIEETKNESFTSQYPDLLESKQVLPIRKVLQGSDIMSIIDRNPREAIKKAIEIVSNSDEVSDKDKYEFKRNMQGNLNKAISTLATYFYDVNKAKI